MACWVSERLYSPDARPVGVGDLGDDLAALLDGVEDGADVELLAEGGLDADLDVVEVDENGDVQAILVRQNGILAYLRIVKGSDRQRPAGCRPTFAAVELAASGEAQGHCTAPWLMADGDRWLPWPIRHRSAIGHCERAAHPGSGQTIRVNWPRCSSSRPLPPRPVTSYLPVLMVCSAPRVVSTVSRSRSPVEAMEPRTRSSSPSLIRMHAFPGPGQEVDLVGLAQDAAGLGGGGDQDLAAGQPARRRRSRRPRTGRAKRRPERVLGSTNASRPKRSA